MIDYKSAAGNEERLTSANHPDISLTSLWEIIVRTKRLPDDIEPKVLFSMLKERLKNPEREIRQHALRVLSDLIPVIQPNDLDNLLDILLSQLINNLAHVAPAVRKGAVDVLKIYLKNTLHPNDVLKNIFHSVPEFNQLKQGLIMAAPSLLNQNINEDTLKFLIKYLFHVSEQEFLKETAVTSLVRMRRRLGKERFDNLAGSELGKRFLNLCQELNVNPDPDNVILETEITLDSGPAITMKIHEENEQYLRLDKNYYESESSDMASKSPRKVRFGGEVVKMRTPESDSNPQSSDDNDHIEDNMQTSLIIDRPTSIKITVGDGVTAIRTRHRSMIPVRITTGSNPSTPKKKLHKKRLHKSAPELRTQTSRIPLRNAQSTRNLHVPKQVRRRSRGEDGFSPTPIHDQIEVLHNLTRSPEKLAENPAKKDTESENEQYESFQVCKDEEIKSKVENPFSIVQDLLGKEDTWSKNQALDEIITLHNQSRIDLNNVPAEMLQKVCSSAKHPHLQSKAYEVIQLFIDQLSAKTDKKLYKELCNGVVRMSGPSGICLSILVMQKSSARQFFENLRIDGKSREKILQVLIAACRIFPSVQIDVVKGTQIAFDGMEDPRRAVRQAALESLASLAQVAGNRMILDTIHNMSPESDKSEQFLRIIRTRLSRRQLPSVDNNGNVRYSSPREQEELDWLCGGTSTLSKTMSLNSIKIPSNNHNGNYWKHNSRHDNFETSPEEVNEENLKAIDLSTLPKIDSIEKGTTLYPVYIVHPQLNGKSYKNFDRGRTDPQSSTQNNEQYFGEEVEARRFFRQNRQFRKSFSSEQIYNGSIKFHDPFSSTMSSRSSSTSTGSSSKGGIWLKSAIPIPLLPETKIKFRSKKTTEFYAGPLIAQQPINRTKLDTAPNTPIVLRPNPPQVFTQFPPTSSGSESSGYFTPPAEHHLKDPAESYEENNNVTPPEAIFQVVDSEVSDVQENEQHSSEASYVEIVKPNEEPEVVSPAKSVLQDNKSLDEVDFEERRHFTEPRCKSRSEVNLHDSLPEITKRKIINSAPPFNELCNAVPFTYIETPHVTQVNISLPGSVTPENIVEETPRCLIRRNISVRTSIKKKCGSKSPTPPEVRPFSRPKEALTQALTQMESNEWEIVMQGLSNLSRLSRNHPEVLETQMHSVCTVLAKNIRNLRSQVARAACNTTCEIITSCRRGLEMELEEIAGPLLQRTADTNKFLRSDANAALDAMTLNIAIPRAVAVIANKGATHQNCVVRASATRLLSEMATRLGADRVYQLPKESRDKFLLVGANGLTEGSLDNRRQAKTLMKTLMKHPQFQRALVEAVPQHTVRHITKIINSLK